MSKMNDLTNQRFGRLVVVKKTGTRNNKTIWMCHCDCGNERILTTSQLRTGHTKSCGCLASEKAREKASNLLGMRFGRLTVLEKYYTPPNSGVKWTCVCDCGNKTVVLASNLTKGHTTSCGCYKTERTIEAKTKHGKTHSRIYRIYRGIKDRCLNPNNERYCDYGGRGIKICKEWLGECGFDNFEKWSLANGYNENLSIDRVNVNGDYEPSNCRWATTKIQNNNQRKNILISYNGEVKTLAQWVEELNLPYNTIYARIYIYHWDVKEAFEREIGDDIWHKYTRSK